MTPFRLNWLYHDQKVGFGKIRIVENENEAQDPDHGWWGNFSITFQLERLGIPEIYPALLIRYIEIEKPFRGHGHGVSFVNYLHNFALEKGCAFTYGAIETHDDVALMNSNINFYLNRGWKIWADNYRGEVVCPLDDTDWFMGYRLHEAPLSIDREYHAEFTEPPAWEFEIERKKYVED